MALQILQKTLDASTYCPICKGAMFWVEAEEYDIEILFHQCSYCEHQIFPNQERNCHCDSCSKNRRSKIKEAKAQEARNKHRKANDEEVKDLDSLSFLTKLFLLSILDTQVTDSNTHKEYIDWDDPNVKFAPFTPNYHFQNSFVKHLVKENILIQVDDENEEQKYYLNVRLDGYADPSLSYITIQLRRWFMENLSYGVPFRDSEEVKEAMRFVLYQEVVQFMQFYCKTWNVKISGNKGFQTLIYRLFDSLAVGQIYYMIQNALDYLHSKNLLKPLNDNFINTNYLKKTIEGYRERSIKEKWETSVLPRPSMLQLSKMSEILLYKFLGYDDKIFVEPIWHSWKKIEPRLRFYSTKRCMGCGGSDMEVQYDSQGAVSLLCNTCKHQDHYFFE